MVRHVYLDYNATTPVHPDVVEAMSAFYREKFGNPSSIHWAGRWVKGAVEKAREKVALLVNCEPVEVVFTSSGTEADNMAIKGVAAAHRDRGNHIITLRTEHPAVANTCLYLEKQGFEITRLGVDRDGLPDLGELEASITDRTILVSAMFANHETGVLLPVTEIAEIAARRRVYFHCDAVQAVGKVPVDFRKSNISLLALSGHKLQAPKGIGALVIRKGVKLSPLIHGGPQERNRRGGTENVAGIVALGRACELALDGMSDDSRRITAQRDRLEEGILAAVPDVKVNGPRDRRLPNTANLSFLHVEADSLLLNLDLQGIAASSGSACSSGVLKDSPVLAAMGVEPAFARGSIRFSLGCETTAAEIDYVLKVLPEIVERLRKH
ncbi:MAG TPA: cysteine desulfurase NifS [Geobacteraceae bacterium]|nr:cysteine desulfurase NifS [Geobacteraceae bacterium]